VRAPPTPPSFHAQPPGQRPPGLIRENPELLVRIDYYPRARSLDDLPVEIQNVSRRGAVGGRRAGRARGVLKGRALVPCRARAGYGCSSRRASR
jgi:hypothetical protein